MVKIRNIKVLAVLIFLFGGFSTFIYQYSIDQRFRVLVFWCGLDNILLDSDGWLNGTLQPHDHPVIPNIAHYTWLYCRDFSFIHLLSLVSAYKVMQPDKIYFHTNCEPEGRWWNEVKLIPILEVKYIEPPVKIFDQELNLNWPEHQSDVARLEVLLKHGGVYFDPDIFVVQSLEPLRRYDYVVGREDGYMLNNGIIMSSVNSSFLWKFYTSYQYYRRRCFNCNSIIQQHNLAEQYGHLIHIENYSMQQPDNFHWKTLFYGKFPWQEGHYTFHIWMGAYRIWSWIGAPRQQDGEYIREFSPENIKELDSSFGEMCRFIYYGNSDIIPADGVAPKPWWNALRKPIQGMQRKKRDLQKTLMLSAETQ
ncbi:uncharacterized protein LOC144435351 [Glandiceps talaboti]